MDTSPAEASHEHDLTQRTEPLRIHIKYRKFSRIGPQPFPNNLSWNFGMIFLGPDGWIAGLSSEDIYPHSNPARATIATLSYFGSR
jgi:hypothetical protein